MHIKGKLKVKFDEQVFDSGFKKREFVITTDDQYPQDVKFELLKDKTTAIDQVAVNQHIEVHFDIRGNEYNGKYYNNLVAWKVQKVNIEAPVSDTVDEEDDLPF